jgi:steroid 5-alpha reductase family enzyme
MYSLQSVDFTGGSNFFILALITLTVNGQYYARQIVASVLQMVWSARLGGFLLFRVLKTGSTFTSTSIISC